MYKQIIKANGKIYNLLKDAITLDENLKSFCPRNGMNATETDRGSHSRANFDS